MTDDDPDQLEHQQYIVSKRPAGDLFLRKSTYDRLKYKVYSKEERERIFSEKSAKQRRYISQRYGKIAQKQQWSNSRL